MKTKQGSVATGIVAAIICLTIIIVATIAVINGNNSITDYSKYDFYSIIEPDQYNGQIGDNVKGNKNAPVLIFEYADFQCPGCASMNSRVSEAIKANDDKLAVVYRNYLLSYHKNGTAAASAAEAAGIQGYWEPYANKLFSEQSEWEYVTGSERSTLFNKYFTEVTNGKGDLDKFNKDLASENVSKKISFDMGIGKRIEIKGTPAFYYDGQYIDWNNSKGGSIIVNGKTISWDHNLSGSEFTKLLSDIVDAKTTK